MNFQIDVSSALPVSPAELPPAAASVPETVDLLRQILEVQREQLAYQRAAAAAHDMTARWRAYLARWQNEFPDLSDGCRRAMPALDRYGMRLAQLGTILNLVAPLAEAGSQNESA